MIKEARNFGFNKTNKIDQFVVWSITGKKKRAEITHLENERADVTADSGIGYMKIKILQTLPKIWKLKQLPQEYNLPKKTQEDIANLTSLRPLEKLHWWPNTFPKMIDLESFTGKFYLI